MLVARFHSPNPYTQLVERERETDLAQAHNRLLRDEFPDVATTTLPLYAYIQEKLSTSGTTLVQQALLSQVRGRLNKLAEALKAHAPNVLDYYMDDGMAQRYIDLYSVSSQEVGYLPGIYYDGTYIRGDAYVRNADPYTILVRMTPYADIKSLFQEIQCLDDDLIKMGQVFFTYQHDFTWLEREQEAAEGVKMRAYSQFLSGPQDRAPFKRAANENPASMPNVDLPKWRFGLKKVWGTSRQYGSHVFGHRWACCNMPADHPGCWLSYKGTRQVQPYSVTFPKQAWPKVTFDVTEDMERAFEVERGTGWLNDEFYDKVDGQIRALVEKLRTPLATAMVEWLQRTLEEDEDNKPGQGPYAHLSAADQIWVRRLCSLIHEYNAIQEQPPALHTVGEWTYHTNQRLFNLDEAKSLIRNDDFGHLLSIEINGVEFALLRRRDRPVEVGTFYNKLQRVNNQPGLNITDWIMNLVEPLERHLQALLDYEAQRDKLDNLVQNTKEPTHHANDIIHRFHERVKAAEEAYAAAYTRRDVLIRTVNKKLRLLAKGEDISAVEATPWVLSDDQVAALAASYADLDEVKEAIERVDYYLELKRTPLTAPRVFSDGTRVALFETNPYDLSTARFKAFMDETKAAGFTDALHVDENATFLQYSERADILKVQRPMGELRAFQNAYNSYINDEWMKDQYEEEVGVNKYEWPLSEYPSNEVEALQKKFQVGIQALVKQKYERTSITISTLFEDIFKDEQDEIPELGLQPGDEKVYADLVAYYTKYDQFYARVQRIKDVEDKWDTVDGLDIEAIINKVDGTGNELKTFKDQDVPKADLALYQRNIRFAKDPEQDVPNDPYPWKRLDAIMENLFRTKKDLEKLDQDLQEVEVALGINLPPIKVSDYAWDTLVKNDDLYERVPTIRVHLQEFFALEKVSQWEKWADVEDEKAHVEATIAKRIKEALETKDRVTQNAFTAYNDGNDEKSLGPLLKLIKTLINDLDTLYKSGANKDVDRILRIQNAPTLTADTTWAEIVRQWDAIAAGAEWEGQALRAVPQGLTDEERQLYQRLKSNAGVVQDPLWARLADRVALDESLTDIRVAFTARYNRDLEPSGERHIGFTNLFNELKVLKQKQPLSRDELKRLSLTAASKGTKPLRITEQNFKPIVRTFVNFMAGLRNLLDSKVVTDKAQVELIKRLQLITGVAEQVGLHKGNAYVAVLQKMQAIRARAIRDQAFFKGDADELDALVATYDAEAASDLLVLDLRKVRDIDGVGDFITQDLGYAGPNEPLPGYAKDKDITRAVWESVSRYVDKPTEIEYMMQAERWFSRVPEPTKNWKVPEAPTVIEPEPETTRIDAGDDDNSTAKLVLDLYETEGTVQLDLTRDTFTQVPGVQSFITDDLKYPGARQKVPLDQSGTDKAVERSRAIWMNVSKYGRADTVMVEYMMQVERDFRDVPDGQWVVVEQGEPQVAPGDEDLDELTQETFDADSTVQLDLTQVRDPDALGFITTTLGYPTESTITRPPTDQSGGPEAMDRSKKIWINVARYTRTQDPQFLEYAKEIYKGVPAGAWRPGTAAGANIIETFPRKIGIQSAMPTIQTLDEFQKQSVLAWAYNSCWIDTLLVILFKMPNTSFERLLRRADILMLADEQCTDADAQNIYNALIRDIDTLHGKIKGDAKCELLRYWNKCVPTKVGSTDIIYSYNAYKKQLDQIPEDQRLSVDEFNSQNARGALVDYYKRYNLVPGGFQSLFNDGFVALEQMFSTRDISTVAIDNRATDIVPDSTSNAKILAQLAYFQGNTGQVRIPIDEPEESPWILHGVAIRTSTEGMHYVGLVRDHVENEWYWYNDMSSTKFRKATPAEQQYLNISKLNGSAYNVEAYFYIRKDDDALQLIERLREKDTSNVKATIEGTPELVQAFEAELEGASQEVMDRVNELAQQLKKVPDDQPLRKDAITMAMVREPIVN